MEIPTWLYTAEQLNEIPSVKGGMKKFEEISYRQQSALRITYAASRLKLYVIFCSIKLYFIIFKNKSTREDKIFFTLQADLHDLQYQ